MAGIDIFIRAKDQASAAINKVNQSLKSLTDETKSVGEDGKAGIDGLGLSFDSLVGKIGIATAVASAGVAAFKKAIEFSQEGAAIERLMDSGDALAMSLGANMDHIVKKVSAASMGTVSDLDIIASANKALLLGVSADADQLAGLMETAIVRGRAMGMTAQEAFEQIVTGIGRQSAKILDNLGIVLDTKQVYDDYAESIGKTADELTEMDQRQALVNATIQNTKGFIEETGGVLLDNAGKWEALDAAQKNYWDNLKAQAAGAMGWWAAFWTEFYNKADQAAVWADLKRQAKGLGVSFEDLSEGMGVSSRVAGQTVYDYEQLAKAISYLQARLDWAENMGPRGRAGVRELVADTENLTTATWELSTAQQQVVDDFNEFTVGFEKITSLSTNFNGIVNYAIKYDDILKELTVKQNELNQYLAIMGTGGYVDGLWVSADEAKTKVGELTGAVAELQTAMTNMANQVVLDMFAATIAIGGVEQAELEAYMNLAVEMGVMSDEAATAAIEAYSRAVTYIETHKIPDMSFNIIGNLIMPDIVMGGGGGGGGFGNVVGRNEAAGGVVHAAAGAFGKQAYYVGEIGPEIFVPSQDGRILSNHESKAAIRSGFGSMNEQPIVININTPINLADRVWVENELAPYIRKGVQDVMARG